MKMKPENLLTEFDNRGSRLLERLETCRTAPDVDAIHDLRVSIRRYLAATDALEQLAGQVILSNKSRKTLKSLLDSYDEVRDLQVMIGDLSSEPEIFLSESQFLNWLKARESGSSELQFTVAERKSAAMAKIHTNAIQKARRVLKKLPPAAVEELLDKVFKRNRKLASATRADDPPTIHKLRIAFKRFRYSVEFFASHLGAPAELFPRLRAYQTALGKVQDASVLIDTMDQFEAEDPANQLTKPERGFAQNRLKETIEDFMNQREKLDTFWRKNHSSPIPWQEVSSSDLNQFINKLKPS